ncbi:YheC/YheD family protein [Oceanobacillus profundus]|uniref:YheC/YheD family protein n=1 Tax=Oceanobacillus TaxID=182709 RepID=UPI0026E309EC|nr:YheC/YheD family protein [Oceanobacillus profundus]MDO6451792.1 YheC/YheD family protein [Oceanobacillus profundus]
MIVGLMRNFIKPTDMARLTAMLCKYQGMDLIYLRPRDVNVNNDTVKGKMLIDNKWVTVETDLPKFIDISPYCFKAQNRRIMDYLRSKTLLSDDRISRLSKAELQIKLKEDKKFEHLVIPTISADKFDNVEEYLERYSTIVMKPIGGQRGFGVFILKKENNTYILGYQKKEKKLTKDELMYFFKESIENKRYIIQKYISSRTLQGDPFDCRVHVEKNGAGKWVSARNFIRIGIGQKVISNVNQGGGISDPEPFLKSNFGEKWEEIINKLNELALSLPNKIEELRKTKLMSMGMDVAIDKNGDLYLFEVNGAPTTTPLRSEAAMLRTEYYKYIMQTQIKQ